MDGRQVIDSLPGLSSQPTMLCVLQSICELELHRIPQQLPNEHAPDLTILTPLRKQLWGLQFQTKV